jgi:hypothetical protein
MGEERGAHYRSEKQLENSAETIELDYQPDPLT